MTMLGLSSKRGSTRISIRVRTAMAEQARGASASSAPVAGLQESVHAVSVVATVTVWSPKLATRSSRPPRAST
jgi:hypothetical protein